MVARETHYLKVAGSIPASAPNCHADQHYGYEKEFCLSAVYAHSDIRTGSNRTQGYTCNVTSA